MFDNKKLKYAEVSKNNYLYLFLFFLIILFYTSIYILSFSKVVNFWSFSQSFMNYSEGFIKRGRFGTIMLFFENTFSIRPKIFFSSFFVFFYSLNIFLFLNYSRSTQKISYRNFFINMSNINNVSFQ